MGSYRKSGTLAASVRKKYGSYLKKERESRCFTQKYVAEHLGLKTPQLISNWERGIAAPPLKETSKLAGLYAVDRNELMEIMTEYHQALCLDAVNQVRQIFADRGRSATEPVPSYSPVSIAGQRGMMEGRIDA